MHMDDLGSDITSYLYYPPEATVATVYPPTSNRPIPNELLLIIKEFITEDDLWTHVIFANISRATLGFYGTDEEQEPFWERLCQLYGLYHTEEDIQSGMTWRQIAFDSIIRDCRCSHPRCGLLLLEWNRHMIAMSSNRRYMNQNHETDPPRMRWANIVFAGLAVNESRRAPLPKSAMDIILRSEEKVTGIHVAGSSLLRDHPIAYRSSAIWPPCRKAHIVYKRKEWLVHVARTKPKKQNRPLTVAHFLNAFLTDPRLDRKLSVDELRDLLTGRSSFVHYTDERRYGFRNEDLHNYRCLRDLWSDSSLFEFEWITEFPRPSFMLRVLPNLDPIDPQVLAQANAEAEARIYETDLLPDAESGSEEEEGGPSEEMENVDENLNV